MIEGEDIERLIQLLTERGASVYHACQFLDFQSYLQVGGIPSRAHLEVQGLPFTGFETDDNDQINSVWDNVFLNLSDFGKTFANGYTAVPNPYGPILLRLRPEALHEASDVAICLRSAGASGFSRENETLQFHDVDRFFAHPAAEGFPQSEWVKFRSQLEQDFDLPGACDPEISCTVISGRLSMKYVIDARVDHYVLRGKLLRDRVHDLRSASGARFAVRERGYRQGRNTMLCELACILANCDQIPSLLSVNEDQSAGQDLRDWARGLLSRDLEYQFIRFAKYWREGTLLPLTQPVTGR